jgi:hypothetical protein
MFSTGELLDLFKNEIFVEYNTFLSGKLLVENFHDDNELKLFFNNKNIPLVPRLRFFST